MMMGEGRGGGGAGAGAGGKGQERGGWEAVGGAEG